ncbi:MAG: RelA/SpoT family protein [Flavobacteriales bacterium]|nr:RelA/SpoT family protein [Flavobacteriales bacterium]|tara:strand:- start:11118 stop:13325 length:2208 start_codon:yes stop_codon:yes gene_type:complete
MNQEAEENKIIINQYRSLIRSINKDLDKDEKRSIRKAFNLAISAHNNSRRESGELYISHPISVAKIVGNDIGLGSTSIICSLLHDVVEDTSISLDDIEKEFGSETKTIISGLTKISGVVDKDVSRQAENFRKMILSISNDIRVVLIKIADRLDNMRTLQFLRKSKQERIASETLYLYAPLAHRLGLYSIKTELEDLSLKFTESDVYVEISKKLNETKDNREKYIKKFTKPIKEKLKKEEINFSVKGRPKSIFSIRKKMIEKEVDFDEVFDKFAIRIIVNCNNEKEKELCWKIYSIVTDFYKPNPDRLRDWISNPKLNGYESLHTTVMGLDGQWVEVQIRSSRMDEIAEKGFAAHWKYKQNQHSNIKIQKNIDSWLNRIRDSLDYDKKNAVEFIDDFKLDLFSEEIFVFSPTGQLVTLPNGATSLDFAFQIHTDLGKSCLGTKVNGKLVPLSHKLKSGDQIEIISSRKQTPKENWLDFVITAKARNKIKNSLKQERKQIAKDGKEILIRKLKHLKIQFSESTVNELQIYFELNDSLDLFYRLGIGKITNEQLKDFKKNRDSWYDFIKSKFIRKKKKTIPEIDIEEKNKLLVFGEEEEVLDYKIATCCQPISGDKVFGFVTIKEGIKIHSISCPNAIRLRTNFSYRIMECKWKSMNHIDFDAIIEIKGIDSVGLVNKITNIISSHMNVNMKLVNFNSDDGLFYGKITLLVKNIKHLEKVIKQLYKIEGVKSINRIKE